MILAQLIVSNVVAWVKFVMRGGQPAYDPFTDPEWDTWTTDEVVRSVLL